MPFVKHRDGPITRLVSLEGIRYVQAVETNPAGGAPRSTSGKIVYSDGQSLDVTLSCAEAVLSTLIKERET